MRKTLFACVIGLIFMSIGFAAFRQSGWDAPPEIKRQKNPLAPSEAILKQAKSIYAEKCSNCHGDLGKGDGSDAMMYDPAPADLSDEARMANFTDGELFYKITVGKKPMPSFQKHLTDEQRWVLVIFVRSLAGSSAPPKLNNYSEQKPSPVAVPSSQH